ncbi:polysaccharide pyruvyl transferase family protein [Vibrio sinaloensis]|uniref:polysaccharide pyruvyl transferase family protein n=1 Tax=Photobacterium sp. (strain ATCC 43367) TaxID=379097 RepID=UPI0035F00DCA
MKLTYYKGDVPNFGDDLNKIMWDRLVETGFFDEDESTLFIGIGSIIWDSFPKEANKIVVGSGYGGYTALPDVHDGSWSFSFVRGPRTAHALNLEADKVVTDSAILTHFLGLEQQSKKYKIGFMPHFQSIPRGNWEKVCEVAGIKFIDPTSEDVEKTLREIQQTELLITEAMHGAILADTLRTPWVALEPMQPNHRNKWYDWSESLSIDLNFVDMPFSNVKEFYARITGRSGVGERSVKLGQKLSFSEPLFAEYAARKLLKIAQIEGQLSADSVFTSKANQALECLAKINGVNIKV